MVWLVAYALTDQWGNIVAPYLVNGVPTGIQASTCLGLTTSPGRVGVNPADRTKNEIVFVTTDPVSGMWVHATTFDIRTMLFGQIDVSSNYWVPSPLNAHGNTIAGIWIAQYNPMNPQLIHHVGISIPNPGNPLGLPGTLVVLTDGTPPAPYNVGGGPLSHVPWGHNPGGGMSGGPAFHMFGPNGGPPPGPGPGPTGWYVVTPGGFLGLNALFAVDPAGVPLLHWVYPLGSTPNGTPLAHPAEISTSGNAARRKGIIWAPYLSGGAAFSLDLVEGAPPLTPSFATALHIVGSPLGGNFAGQPALPKSPANPPWPGTVILRDQKTNFKAEYGLYLPGY